jgi:hypothetical protein
MPYDQHVAVEEYAQLAQRSCGKLRCISNASTEAAIEIGPHEPLQALASHRQNSRARDEGPAHLHDPTESHPVTRRRAHSQHRLSLVAHTNEGPHTATLDHPLCVQL